MDIYDGRPVITGEDHPLFISEILRGCIGQVGLGELAVDDPDAWIAAAKTSSDQLEVTFTMVNGAFSDRYASETLAIDFDGFETALCHYMIKTTPESAKKRDQLLALSLAVDGLRLRLL
ncbi:MAG: hypothetical protein JWP13_316 [Candidatus Saccharibacteria bacterium]|nr:hypothetical protein [Candidatus Saccharibacteria bacterium]